MKIKFWLLEGGFQSKSERSERKERGFTTDSIYGENDFKKPVFPLFSLNLALLTHLKVKKVQKMRARALAPLKKLDLMLLEIGIKQRAIPRILAGIKFDFPEYADKKPIFK